MNFFRLLKRVDKQREGVKYISKQDHSLAVRCRERGSSITASPQEIEVRSAEMTDVTISMLARAIGLRKGDDSISFGRQFLKK